MFNTVESFICNRSKTTMDRVRFPGTDIEISALCLGVAEIGVRQTEIEAHRLLDYWVRNGGGGVNTARVGSDSVAGGESRNARICGEWAIKTALREQVIFVSKAADA